MPSRIRRVEVVVTKVLVVRSVGRCWVGAVCLCEKLVADSRIDMWIDELERRTPGLRYDNEELKGGQD